MTSPRVDRTPRDEPNVYPVGRLRTPAEAVPMTAKTTSLRIRFPGMCCPVEFNEIERTLEQLSIEFKAFPDYGARRVRIECEPGAEPRILEALRREGIEHALEAASLPRRIRVPEMDCPVEAGEIEAVFRSAGFTDYEVRISEREIRVPDDDAAVELALSLIAKTGYGAAAIRPTEASGAPEPDDASAPWGRYGVALASAFLSEAVELAGEYGVLDWGSAGEWVSFGAALAAILLVGLGTFKKGLMGVMRGRLSMNALMAVAVVGGVLIGAWPEAAMVMVLFEISEAIEGLTMARARRSIKSLMSLAPERARVESAPGVFELAPTASVPPGSLIRVDPGERVPLDARITKGSTTLDQSMVTGESMPVEKGAADDIWAGTVNLTGSIEAIVTAPASKTLAARIIETVENAQAAKSQTQRFVDRFASVYTPIVFAAAAAVALIPPVFLGNPLEWIYRGLCLLVIGCPCALVISTPVTIISALATATRCGILVKGGLFLEEARKLRTVGLDKTGTLTRGEPEVASIELFAGVDEASALRLAASLGTMNRHPLSRALVDEAKRRNVVPGRVENYRALPGEGVEGCVDGAPVRLLSRSAYAALNFADQDVLASFDRAAALGRSASVLVDALGAFAVFSFADELKPEARADLAELRAVGLEPVLLTGDNARAAAPVAQALGLKHVESDLLPAMKLERIRSFQSEGLTAMVGDGINDAPALAQADIGVAMGVRGTDSAVEAADVVLMDDRIGSLATLVRLSKMTHAVLVENIVFALGVKIVFAALAATGMATMWMAVFADTGTCLIVVANALRMLRQKPKLEALARKAAD